MKKIITNILILLSINTSLNLSAAIGCMSKSDNLSNGYDYKTYHYVQCNCPCGSNSRYAILSNRGLCKECGHAHELKPIKIIKGSLPQIKAICSKNIFTRFFQKNGSLIFN